MPEEQEQKPELASLLDFYNNLLSDAENKVSKIFSVLERIKQEPTIEEDSKGKPTSDYISDFKNLNDRLGHHTDSLQYILNRLNTLF